MKLKNVRGVYQFLGFTKNWSGGILFLKNKQFLKNSPVCNPGLGRENIWSFATKRYKKRLCHLYNGIDVFQ